MTNLKVCLPDVLVDSVDWLSIINDGISYNEMLILLDTNSVKFEERYFMSKKYVVVDKLCYEQALRLVFSYSSLRITRIDIKFDFTNKFEEIVSDNYSIFEPYSTISKHGKLETIYFNSRQTNLFCRLYDKQAESHLDTPLTRLEFEIKGDLALEFSKRLSFLGLVDASNFIFDKINEFCARKHLTNLFYVTTKSYLPMEFLNREDTKYKFRNFVRHNSNSYKKYMKFFDISPAEFDSVMSGDYQDLEEFLKKY